MIALLIAVLMVVLPLLHLAFSKMPGTPERVVHILLLYALVFGVGIIGLPMGFIPHVFFPDQTADQIGNAVGNRIRVSEISGAEKKCDSGIPNKAKDAAYKSNDADRRRRPEHRAVFAHSRGKCNI